MNVTLAIPAAGVGERFSKNVKKQFYKIDSMPILYFTLKNMLACFSFSQVVLGINETDREEVDKILSAIDNLPEVLFAKGGKVRAETVMNCVNITTGDIILVHDGVRPFVSKDIVSNVVDAACEFGGAIPALPVRDTVKKALDDIITETVIRENLYLAHTPQGFKTDLLKKALSKALEAGEAVTDEASAFEYCGMGVKIVGSSWENIKITYSDDLEIINMLKEKYFK